MINASMNRFICSDIQEHLSHVCFFAQTVILDRKFRSFLIFPKWKFTVVYCLNAFLVSVHSFFYQLSYEFEKFVDIMYIRKYKMKNTACPIPMHNLNSAPWFLKIHFQFLAINYESIYYQAQVFSDFSSVSAFTQSSQAL